MKNTGYISLHRKIQEHFLFKEERVFSKFEAWIDILMTANHTDNKFLHGNQLMEVKRGSFITSELKLMKRWNWSKTKVRSFLSLLESDLMLVKNTDSKKTTLTVLNYEDYQDSKTTKEPQKNFKKTSKKLQKNTNNNDNNINNVNNENIEERKLKFSHTLQPFLETYSRELLIEFNSYWTEHGDMDKKMRFEKEKSFSLSRRLSTWKNNEAKFKNNGKQTTLNSEEFKSITSAIRANDPDA